MPKRNQYGMPEPNPEQPG